MTQQEILDGNKLIAEFMKPASYDKRRKDYPFPFPVIEIVPAEKIMGYGNVPEGEIKHYSGQPNMMKYHSDWNWLMLAIERIRFIEDNQEEFFGEEYYLIHFEIDLLHGVDLRIDRNRIFMQTAFGEGQLIDAVYAGVIEFINWFNRSKKEEND